MVACDCFLKVPEMWAGACFSDGHTPLNRSEPDRRAVKNIYRNLLWRRWSYHNRALMGVVMLNPSTADEYVLYCWGRTKNGSPKHPLYLRADTALEPFAWT